MTKGRELPVNCKARRRLFSEDEANPEQEGGITRSEYVARNLRDEVIHKGMRWNFDFKNEVALDGPIQWYQKGSEGEWVGMQPTGWTPNMRKRKMDPECPTNAAQEDERSKAHRQILLTRVRTRELFENLVKQLAEDDNQINIFNEEFRQGDNTLGNVIGFEPHGLLNTNSQDKRDDKTCISEVEELAANKAEADRIKIFDEKIPVVTIGGIATASDEFLPEEEHINLRISEINNILQEVPERLGMMTQNQATPRNEKNNAVPQAKKAKVLKKQVWNEGAKKRINFD